MFFIATPLSSKILFLPIGNSGVLVIGFILKFLIMLSTTNLASPIFIGLPFAALYLCITLATSSFISAVGLYPSISLPLLKSTIL